MLFDVASALMFTGSRGGELTAITTPDLVSPTGHPQAVKRMALYRGKEKLVDCYPWITGGATISRCGLVKHATVRGVFGPDWAKMVTDERLRQACSLDADGNPVPYVCGAPENGTQWVHGADGQRFAFKTNPAEDRLYATIVIARSLGASYFDADGNPVDASVVRPFLAPLDDGKRQGLDTPLVYRDYRADRVVNIRVGSVIAAGDMEPVAAALLAGGRHPQDGSRFAGLTARQITDSLVTIPDEVAG